HRYKGWRQRVSRRELEGTSATDHEHRSEEKIASQNTLEQRTSDNHGGQYVDALCHESRQTSVVTVGGVSDQKRQHDGRDELYQSHKAKIQSTVGKLVDLPADRQGQHLIAHGRGKPREPEQHERALLN